MIYKVSYKGVIKISFLSILQGYWEDPEDENTFYRRQRLCTFEGLS